MCLYPQLVKNPKYKANKKNKGIPPSIKDERVKYVPIGCKSCIECRKQKAREWQVRMLEHIKTNTNGKFITLTFSNESIRQLNTEINEAYTGTERDNAIATLAVRRFLERWRKKYKTSIKHWLVTELGHNGTENIHLHGIIWLDNHIIRTEGRGKHKHKTALNSLDELEKMWKYGFVWKGKKILDKTINYVNGQTINYIIKYVNKVDEKNQTFKSKIFCSPGIGDQYPKSYNAKRNKFNPNGETNELYITSTGHKIAMPIYWRNKLYTEEQREILWIKKLDKEERWVCGEKVSVKHDDKDYYNLLKHHQKINISLGYGNGQISWERKEYEKEQRRIKLLTRIRNAEKKASGGVFQGYWIEV